MILENLYHTLLLRIESALSGRYWLWKLIAFSTGLSLFLAFPPYHLFWDHFTGVSNLDAWSFIKNQSQNLFQPDGIELNVRRENMIFRWTLPVLSFLTGHNLLLILLLQAILGVLFIYWIGKYSFELTGNKVLTALFVLTISHIFTGIWHFAEVHGYGDGIAWFCLLAAMLQSRRRVVFPLLLAGYFTDERAVMAGGFILLWNVVNKAYNENAFDGKSLISSVFLGRNLVVWLTFAIYFAVRFYVQNRYFQDHSYSTMGTPVLFERAHRNGLGSSLWSVFEAAWLLIISAGTVVWLTKRRLFFLMLLIGFLTLIVSGVFVHDIDRSLSYGFPFLLISFFILHREVSVRAFRLLLFFCAFICIIHPQIFYMGYNQILWLEPLPLKIIQLVDQLCGWHFFD